MKNLWIVANWKSHKNIAESLEWISQVGPELPIHESLKVVVCPPFLDVSEVKKEIKVGNFPILVGVQDLSPFEEGPYTGEEAASILKDVVDLAILGHSERRQNFQETDELIAQKAQEAKKYNIIPLVCIQNENTPIPEGVTLVAFEPVEAIGSGHPDTPEDASSVASQIKNSHGESMQVLYGGSVTSTNCEGFLKEDRISGLLIGGASLEALEFVKIVQLAYNLISDNGFQTSPDQSQS
jgi:triosephosphate isomerase (TIM)